MTAVGRVYAAPERSRAVFLTADDIASLQQSIATFRQRPTVAGPSIDTTAFDTLADSLARGAEPNAPDDGPVILTVQEQRYLELLMGQAAVRAALPLRIRRACTACGNDRIVNPALPKRTAPSKQMEPIVSSVKLLSEGHPILAGLNFLAGAAENQESPPVCERCEGVDFNDIPVTFCPTCHELRAETILLTCPACGHDFASAASGAGVVAGEPSGIWTEERAAGDAFALAKVVATLREQSPRFENGFYPEQLALLTEALGPHDDLVGLCRCGLPTEMGRYVALLLTSEQIAWSRQSLVSGPTGGTLAWRDVAEVRELPGAGNAAGLEVRDIHGKIVKFNDFRGSGVTFGTHVVTFTAGGILDQARRLHARHHPAAVAGSSVGAPTVGVPSVVESTVAGSTVVAPAESPVAVEPPTAALSAPPTPAPVPPPASLAYPGPAPVPLAPLAHPASAPVPTQPAGPPPSTANPPPAPPSTPAPVPAPTPPTVRPQPHPPAQAPSTPPAPAPPTAPVQAPPTPPVQAPPAAPRPQPAPTYTAPTHPAVPPGWYPDPWRVARLRWWDGVQWTGYVAA